MCGSNFVCDTCETIDSIYATPQHGGGWQCHRCKHGEWHGQFAEEKFDPEQHGDMMNRTGYGGDQVSFS